MKNYQFVLSNFYISRVNIHSCTFLFKWRERKKKIRILVDSYGLRQGLTLLSLLIWLICRTYYLRKLSARVSLILTVTKTLFEWLRPTLIRCYPRLTKNPPNKPINKPLLFLRIKETMVNNRSSFHVKWKDVTSFIPSFPRFY